jgi:hypothetical protein
VGGEKIVGYEQRIGGIERGGRADGGRQIVECAAPGNPVSVHRQRSLESAGQEQRVEESLALGVARALPVFAQGVRL